MMILSILTPKTVNAGWQAAMSEAQDLGEPVFVPINPHVDDRGWSLMNLMTGILTPGGQINFSVQHPGVIKAWHRHREQTDVWVGLQGYLKAGVHDQETGKFWSLVLGQMRPGALIIPPPLWHGAATVGAEPAGLLYFVTHGYDPSAPDEERAAYDAFEGFPWGVQHR